MLKIKNYSQNSLARTGYIDLNGTIVQTPVFMPVGTRGAIKALSLEDIKEIGYKLILANTYHLYLKPGVEILESFHGLKNFMSYKDALLTDSGGFQIFSLSGLFQFMDSGVKFQSHIDGSKHEFTPEKVLNIQKTIGSDIAMVLDDCPPYGADKERLAASLKRTHQWAKKSIEYGKKELSNQKIFGIVQGGTDIDLRKNSLAFLQDLPFDGIALGGLSVGEPRELYAKVLKEIGPFLDSKRPRYLMGVGTVPDILEGVKNGIDMFDCVLPTRNARNGQVFSSKGKINLKNEQHKYSEIPIDPKCDCKVCKNYSLGYLRHLHTVGELLGYTLSTYHNLYFYFRFMQDMRLAIENSSFHEFYNEWMSIYGPV
ncbi:MAG: tRNA guanosine(34) transglycosylase Tgt [Leptospiraceae bacterium]|nr:tRNA guanosine(34) transglycosylase Tgt [Leptospiraceae bacterium]MCP5493098.1 tRNA guanosine(34) transglycosylase Tgt [Leptospiraceae bacterium]